MTGWQLFFSVFGIIFIAELPDKTTLAALVLSTRHKPAPVFVGAALALTVQSVIAVAAGRLIALLPARPVHIAAGAVFVISALVMWFRKDEDEVAGDDSKMKPGFWSVAWTVFVVVFIAELGDLTQLATAALAARYQAAVIVFAASALALWSVAGIAVFIGHHAGKWLDPKRTEKVAAVIFAALGIALIAGRL